MGRDPSMEHNTAEPAAFVGRSARNSFDGFGTGRRPADVISNTPNSLTAPKRFLTARTTRWEWWRSPSKYNTVSTTCSSAFGPARLPSLVTWPTRNVGMLRPLAVKRSCVAASRTWPMLPGADWNFVEYIVCTE